MNDPFKVTIEHCYCGHPNCKDYWLVGFGKFVQSSGFTKAQAEWLARLINENVKDAPREHK